MALIDSVRIARRFQRSIRIDSDFNDAQALEGFICPKSSADVLRMIAHHVSETGHGAFTWTGPYGSGKSSLAVALSALLGGEKTLGKAASVAIGKNTANAILKALPPKTKGWRVLPVVGRRDHAAQVIGEAVELAGFKKLGRGKTWNDAAVVSALVDIANEHPRSEGGLILFVDEMGKFLEAAAQDRSDIYLFQLLAEAASRSNRRFIFIGVLHQSFQEYAGHLSREMRDEWAKIQGRFVDLTVNSAGEEQIEIISRAIEAEPTNNSAGKLAEVISTEIKRQKPAVSSHLTQTLERCWPLHPIVACLLGPISRRRFGQNQRSIFGFLNSAEPHGFQDFLHYAPDEALYEPHMLWDYLRVNLEPSILASPDGHRWAMAAEAIERCESLGGDVLHVHLLKSLALIDMFKERSGLVPSAKLLEVCVSGSSKKAVRQALEQLSNWSLIIFRKFTDAYVIYAGSDFDIDQALRESLEQIRDIDFSALQRLVGLQPILAKRHYHETGALRWFDIEAAPLNEIGDRAAAYNPRPGTIGQFVLAIPTESESEETANKLCREAARQSKDWDIVVGLSHRAWGITELARELIALERVREAHPDLAGDPIAQREVKARQSALQGQLEEELRRSFDNASWHLKGRRTQHWLQAELNGIASELADRRYPQAPILCNELLNRIKPSTNAVAAQNILLRSMVTNEGLPRLGIEGFPAEGGLFASMLEATKLYVRTKEGWKFSAPAEDDDPCRLASLWKATIKFLKSNEDRTVSVSELYDLWGAPPFGVKEGTMPLLAVAFILSRRDKVALYREGVFQARFKDLDVEILAKDSSDIQLRWMDLSEVSRRLLSSMAEVVRDLDKDNRLTNLTPIDVARGLIAIYERLHSWTKRTAQLSSNAVRVRNMFKHANDPNKFLFDDIPATFGNGDGVVDDATLGEIVRDVRDGLEELVDAYPSMLGRLCDIMLRGLQVPNMSPQSLAELRERAENIKGLGGDFRLDAFVNRMSVFAGSEEDIEGILSLAANKPPRNWTDPDFETTAIEISDLAQKFIRNESFAHVKGRKDKRHVMAVFVGGDGRPTAIEEEFNIADTDRGEIEVLIRLMQSALDGADQKRRNVILAALAELSARYMAPSEPLAESNDERAAS